MAAKWKWNTVNIYVDDQDVSREVKRAELQRLDATVSTFHYFGAASRRYHVKGIIVGISDRSSIESDAINNIARTFTTPWETIDDCYIDGTPKFAAKKYAGGVLDGVPYTVDVTPLYEVDLEIIT